MVEALEVQLQLGKEKLETMIVEFHKVSIIVTKVEEKVALKATDKLRLTFHNKILEEGTLKATHITEQVHMAFQTKEPTNCL
jgi:predicted regulator of Ras-like GTPase activity (Roadblock/LC7/MglB family)